MMAAVVDRLADDLTADAALENELKREADKFAENVARIYGEGFKKKLQQAKARGMH